MTYTVFDNRTCTLGEGPLWHPERQQLFWFDILKNRLLTRENGIARHWQFEEHVSAAGWVDDSSLMVASETGLFHFSLDTGKSVRLIDIEATNLATRSNDGRADPWGGFWIGTMGFNAETGAGAIYRYFKGEVRQLFPGISIPNAICFAPDGRCAYFADTKKQIIWRQNLSEVDGWPEGTVEVFRDFGHEGIYPDGAVIDASGHLWNAQWGASMVSRYDEDGNLKETISLPASHITCPAFGGTNLDKLYITSAKAELDAQALHGQPNAGMTFCVNTVVRGRPENRVILG